MSAVPTPALPCTPLLPCTLPSPPRRWQNQEVRMETPPFSMLKTERQGASFSGSQGGLSWKSWQGP